MRIDVNHGPQSTSESNPSSASSAASAGNASASRALGEDQAQLSGAHLWVEALAAQAAQLPEIRQERVQALRQAVLGGDYDVSPEQVAGAMFSALMASPAA